MIGKPTLRAAGGIYVLDWKDLNLSIRTDRLYEDSKYNVSAEVRIETSAPGFKPHIHQARLNLTSTTARRTIAGHLEKAVAMYEGEEWGQVIEMLCVMVLDHYRAGEPAVRLGDIQPREGLKYLVEPLLLAGQPNLFFGDGGSTKSMLAAYLGVLVQEGRDHLGMAVEKGQTLYLDWEDSVYEIHERVAALRQGLNLSTDQDQFLYRRCSHSLAGDLESIQRMVVDNRVTMVIVDSAAYACGGEPKDAQPAIGFFNALRALNVTSLTIAHQPKDMQDNHRPFGSVFWQNGPRSIFQVRKTQEAGDDTAQTGLFHTKANIGKPMKPLGFELQFSSNGSNHLDSVMVRKADIRQIPNLADGLPLKDQIAGMLTSGAMFSKDIAEALGAKEASVTTVLYRNKEAFQRQGDKRWGLPYRGDEPPF